MATQRQSGGGLSLDGDGRPWAEALMGHGAEREAALGQVRALLTEVAWFELERRRAEFHELSAAQAAQLVHDAGESAYAALLDRLGDYRGRSRFGVWAAKFAIRETAAAARRCRA